MKIHKRNEKREEEERKENKERKRKNVEPEKQSSNFI